MKKDRLINCFTEILQTGNDEVSIIINDRRTKAIKFLQSIDNEELTPEQIDEAFAIDMG